MQTSRLNRVLKEMMKDRKAMAPPMPRAPPPKPASPPPQGGKPAGGQQPAQGGGLGQASGGGMPGGGNPLDMIKGMWNTESVQLIKGHKQKIEELKQRKEQEKQNLTKIEQQIESVNSQLKQNDQQQKQELEEQKKYLNDAKSAAEKAISSINNEIEVEEAAISKLKGDVSTERKLAVASLVPEAGVAAMAAQQGMHMKHQMQEGSTAKKEQGAEQKIGQEDSKAQSAGASAASAGQAASAAKASSPTPSAGGGGLGKLAEHTMEGKGGEGNKLSLMTLFMVIGSVLAGAYIWTASGTADPMTVFWVLLPLVLFIAALILKAETKGNRGRIATVIMILLFVGAAYGLTTRTGPFIYGAWNAGTIQDTAGKLGSVGAGLGIGATTDFSSSLNKYVASATGERIEGDVDKQVKDEVGIEILPPYLPNPKKLNANELRGLEIGARIKGFDPKNVMRITTVCHMQTRTESQDLSKAWSDAGKGPNINPGTEQTVRPPSFEGNNFDREVTCYPKPSGCDNYIITLSSQSDHLRTDAQMQNFIIDKEVLRQRLENYAKSYSKEMRSQSQIDSAVNEIYKGQLGSYKSVSDKAAIKVVMATQPVALIGVDQDTELVLKAGVENMMAGWIREINSFEITIPEYFNTMSEYCEGWERDGNKLRIKREYLNVSSIRQTAKGQQKIFPSCRLVPVSTDRYQLTEPTEATFLASVDYNYLVQEKYELEVRKEDGTSCNTRTTSGGASGGSSGTATAQNTAKAGTEGSATPGNIDQEELQQAKEACSDKNEGDSCGDKQFCMTNAGSKVCVPECIYYAKTAQSGLTSNYDCVKPSSACNPAAIRTFSCSTPWLTGTGWTCCAPRTAGGSSSASTGLQSTA